MLNRIAPAFGFEANRQLAFSGDDKVGGAILVAEGVAAYHDRMGPARNQPWYVLADDGFAEDGAAQNVADRPIGRAPHFLQAELFDACLVGRDRRALDAHAVFFDGLGAIDGDLIVRFVARLDAQVVIF